MIVDLRTYTLQMGAMRDFLDLYAREGRAVQTQHLGAPLGYYTTEVGDLSQVVHLWHYADMADRERRRAALEADERWLAYRSKSTSRGHVVRQHNSLLKAVEFAAMALPPQRPVHRSPKQRVPAAPQGGPRGGRVDQG